MKRYLRLLPILAALLFLGACQAPRRPDQLTFPPLTFEVPAVEKFSLPNGIRVYYKEDHELPLVEVSAVVGAGSISDPDGRIGQGGLFGAVLRSGGTADRSPDQLDETLAQLAADFSVVTDTYTTTIGLSLLAADLPQGLSILSEVLRQPAFAEDRFGLARRQAIEGIRRRDDEPEAVAQRLLMAAIYGDHPLGRSATVESVRSIERQDLIDFHRRYFHPNNLWLAVSGDIGRDELVKLLGEVFGDWAASEFTPQQVPPVSAATTAEVLVASKDLPQTTVRIGELGIDKSAPDLHAVRVMNFLLGGGGFNSRLMREVRSNRGLAYSVYSYYQIGRRLPGPFLAGCETKSETTAPVLALMRELMQEMREEPVSEEELRLARESLINSFVFAFTDSHEIVTQVMNLDYYGYPPFYLETYRDRLAEVTVEAVQQAARDHLHPDRQVVVLVGDRDAFAAELPSLGLPVREVTLTPAAP